MTLFNGLLCAAGNELGCQSVAGAQEVSGRWHRSVRLRKDPTLKRQNSFSWDMALGAQLYAVKKKDKASLQRWLAWVEEHRPCLIQRSHGSKKYCIVRGLPRWCADDTEKGCTAKPNGLALLQRTIRFLGIEPPKPAVTDPPTGLTLNEMAIAAAIESSKDANATLSLKNLLEKTADLQPELILIDAAVNREGFPRHLTATEILLYRMTGPDSPDVHRAAAILSAREPHNAFFAYLAGEPKELVAKKVLALAPSRAEDVPFSRAEWTWQRAQDDQAWIRSKMWDFVFMAGLLRPYLP